MSFKGYSEDYLNVEHTEGKYDMYSSCFVSYVLPLALPLFLFEERIAHTKR